MPTRNTRNHTSFHRTTGGLQYKEGYRKKTLSSLREVIKKIENREFEVESFGWWQEGTSNKFTFQLHVKDS